MEQSILDRPWDPQTHLAAAHNFLKSIHSIAARQEYARAGALGAPRNEVCKGIGLSLLIDQRPSEAIPYFEELISSGEKTGAAYLAAALAMNAAHERAQEVAESAGEFDPRDVNLCFLHAIYSAYRGDYEQAETFLHRAIEADKQFMPSVLLLAQLLLDTGKVQEAEPYFKLAAEKNSKNISIIYGLAYCFYLGGKFDEAQQTIRTAMQDGLRYPGFHEVMGLALIAKRRFEGAIRSFEKLLGDGIFHESAVQHIAYCYAQMRQFDGVLEFIESQSSKDRGLPTLLRLRAEAILRLKGAEEALPLLEEYAEKHPDDVEGRALYLSTAITNIASTNENKVERLRPQVKKLQEDFPGAGEADMLLARLAGYRRSFREALQHIDSAVAKMPSNADAHFFRGDLMLKAGGRVTKEVFQEWQEATRLDPLHGPAWWCLATAALERGDKKRVLQVIDRAVRAGCNPEIFREIRNKC